MSSMSTHRTLSDSFRPLLAALNERNIETADHCNRTCQLATALGRECDLGERELMLLCVAGNLHDLGKIGIPDRVLLKPAKLNAEEMELMKSHSARGQHILLSVKAEGISEIANIVRHHHEAFDGSGYPDSLAGEAIPILARIIALADSYDALGENRPYRPCRDHDEIMRIIQEENSGRYDPYLWTKFCHLLYKESSLRIAPHNGN